MSVQAIAGPRLDLDGPPPVAPRHSLLKTPGVVVLEDDLGRWLNGVNLIGYPEAVPLPWNACDPDATGTAIKEEGEPGPQAQFDPFVCYLPVTCSALSYPYLTEWSERVLEATYSFAVEEALVGKVAAGLTPNPALGDSNVTILGGGAKSPIVALSYLENAIGETGRAGLIHATPATVAQLNTDTFLDPEVLRTGAGQDWMFASGPVEVRISPMAITDLVESLDRSDNVLTFRAERWVLVTWDTALQSAVLVDWDS